MRESDIGQLSLKGIFSRPGILVEHPLELIGLDERLNQAKPDTVDLILPQRRFCSVSVLLNCNPFLPCLL